jgi:hypothetical protein
MFISVSSILLFSVGTSLSKRACDAASVWSIVAYLATKLCLLAFLLERGMSIAGRLLHVDTKGHPSCSVYLVHDLGVIPRHRSWTYRLSLLPLLCILGVFINAIVSPSPASPPLALLTHSLHPRSAATASCTRMAPTSRNATSAFALPPQSQPWSPK